MKFSHVLPGNSIPENVKKCLEEQPGRSGMYNWIFLHQGEINIWEQIKDRLDEYDQIQINMSPADLILIPEIRRKIDSSGAKTKLILNNDYVCEYWGKWNIDPFRYDEIQRMGDMVFGTEENQVSNMIDGTFCIPHPTNTEGLKHLGSAVKGKKDHIAFIYHWWAPDNMYIPARMLRKLKEKYGLKLKMYGFMARGDSQMEKYRNYLFDEIVELESFPDFAQAIQGAALIFDPNPMHTYGRNGVEAACFRIPVVGSNRVFSYNLLFKPLTVDPYNFREVEKAFDKVLNPDNTVWLKELLDKAYIDVEYFNYENSRKRWEEACEIAFKRGGRDYYGKQT